MGFCAALIIFVVLLNIILANDAAREAVIDFMLLVLEKFHHQPEMEIISIESRLWGRAFSVPFLTSCRSFMAIPSV